MSTRPTILPEVRDFLAREHGHFIGGRAVAAPANPRIAVVDPADGNAIASIAAGGEAEVDAAVAAARAAFRGAWLEVSPAGRAAVLHRLADLLQAHREPLAQLETLQSGKLIALSRAFEIDQACAFLRHYASWATRIHGETIAPSLPSFRGERYSAFTRREPVGVVAGIVPWNFATLIAIWKLGSALATGCTIVLKPSEFTPLTLLRIAELALEAGVPAGALNVVTGAGAVGEALVRHPDVAKISFTGSVPTGTAVGRLAIESGLKRTTLELGGKNSVGFLPDVPVQRIVAGVMEAGFVHQGQVCAAGERFFVPRARLDDVLTHLSERLGGLRIGDPLDEATEFGPLANQAHRDKVASLLARAPQDGSTVVHGGGVLPGPGCFLEPALVRASRPDAALLGEETFGPVATFLPYDDEEELLALMNGTPFGLAASVWTNDLDRAMRLIPRIEAGTVWVNMHTLLDPAVPFGGIKRSGIGREFGGAFIDAYTELKSVMIRHQT